MLTRLEKGETLWNEENIQSKVGCPRGWSSSGADLKRWSNENILDAHPYAHTFRHISSLSPAGVSGKQTL